MKIKIEPSVLSGSIDAIPSKSDAHRLLIASFLSNTKTEIYMPSASDDIDTTIDCIRALGGRITKNGDFVVVERGDAPKSAVLNCRESGSTLRFMIPVASVICSEVSFEGSGRLPSRPISQLLDAMRENGAEFNSDRLPLTKTGTLKSGTYRLPGNVSSQYITGLLFALPLLEGNSQIEITTPLESSSYIDITLWALERFGVSVQRQGDSFYVKGSQKYISPSSLKVDGDWSNASYFLASGLVSSGVSVRGLDMHSPQGDKKITDVFVKMGGLVETGKDITTRPSNLVGCEIDISDIPDMFPTLAVLATRARGTTVFTNGARLRLKESDRIETTARLITSLGGKAEVLQDGLKVECCELTGGIADGSGDHRIVMAAALAATMSSGAVIIDGAEAVAKSYPSFFEDYNRIGGKSYVI